MKKNAMMKDFFREIRGSLNRYLSILCIVALGVAFYAGIRSAQPDMELSADALYDQQNMMDVRVLSALGMTEEDVAALRAVEGVSGAQGGYSVDALTDAADTHAVVSVQSIADGMNRLTLAGGRMPEKANECFLDQAYMEKTGIALGDAITVYADDGEDILDALNTDTFTVVGYGSYAGYLNRDRGAADIGNGDVSFFLMAPPEAFALEAYTAAYLTCDGADGLVSFSDEYQDEIDAVIDRIEAIADERCALRYQQVRAEGADKIADARRDIADGEQELADARSELVDAQQKLDDAAQEIADGEKEIADGERELADARAEIRGHEREIMDGWEAIFEAKEELAQAAEELHSARVELVGGSSAISNNRRKLNQQSQQFDAFAGQAEGLKTQQGYQEAKNNYEQLQSAQGSGAELTQEQKDTLGFYDQILPQVGGALDQAGIDNPTDEMLGQIIDGALQPTRDAIDQGYSQLNRASKKIERGRGELAQAEQEYQDALDEVAENEQKLIDGQAEIDEAWDEVRRAERELADGKRELEEGRQEYQDAQIELADAQAEFDEKSADAEADIAEAKTKVADAQQELDELEVPEWFVLDRQSIQSYAEYGLDAERIGAIGQVFPAIFFLVAALVSLTTMTRMVEEQRLQIGTLKALGYTQLAIAAKFIGYALSATLIGSVIGVFAGGKLLPCVVMSAYNILYDNMTVMLTPIQWDLSLSALLIAVLCTVLATCAACSAAFRAAPAALMRPVAPPQGRRVLLERVPGLWKKLSFSQKATFRNLFRYQKRFWMTVFGIGACMGLLLVAFGLRNSISEIVNKQYATVWTYDVSVSFDGEDEAALSRLDAALDAMDGVQARMSVQQLSIDARGNGVTKGAYLFVPERAQDLEGIVRLQDRRTHARHALTDEGVVITEKLARLLSVQAGESITLMRDETEEVTVPVTAVTENYLFHYVYMTPALYGQLFGEAPEYSAVYLRTSAHAAAESLLAVDGVTGISYVSDLQAQVSDMMRSLDAVIWVLVFSAGLLAFIVLYNLNNIAMIERRRELATLKVLGFHNVEVAGYLYRENVWLTLMGVLLGVGIGFFLHKFIIRTCEVDMMMFGQTIQADSYLYSVALTFLFALVVNLFMFFKIRRIDMVESLKSVE